MPFRDRRVQEQRRLANQPTPLPRDLLLWGNGFEECLFLSIDEESQVIYEMASVTSQGLHQPTGLQYAIQERLLPPDPPRSSYTWQTHADWSANPIFSDDELLITPRGVIWSRGGLFRKCYRFDLDDEPVTQALLTTFPTVSPIATTGTKSAKQDGLNKRAPAIVVFLKTQAHVFFVSGTSHVIHLPFEVESAIAAPNGMILQRKLRVDNLVPASLKFPRVPPNSFVSSQPQPWSAASSQQSSFSIADMNAPKRMPLPPSSTLKDLWDPPSLKDDSHWPRLFSLSDPLAEMGLVVAQADKPRKGGRRRSSTRPTMLDAAEEILHITGPNRFSSGDSEHSTVLAVTLNRETSVYNVWELTYVGQESVAREGQHLSNAKMSRHRSSFVPGAGTGATTPVPGSQQILRESLAGNTKAYGQEDESRDEVSDFASTLDPDFETSAIPRRKSRRVSSMLARADLSASHERSAFTDLAAGHQHASTRRGESMGSQHARTSTGPFAPGNGQNNTQSQFNLSTNSFLEAPVDDLLDELRAGGDFEGFHNMGLDDEEFDALRQEIVLTKVCSVPAEHSNVRYSSQHVPANSQCKVFTLTAPSSAADDPRSNTIIICILDPNEKRLLVITLLVNSHPTAQGDSIENGNKPRKVRKNISVVTLGPITRAKGVIDACRLDDGRVSRILVLSETPDGCGELSLQAPWSFLMKVPLPQGFYISNIADLSHDRKREESFVREPSPGPGALCGLRNSKQQGIFDLVDDEGNLHQLQLVLQPRNPHVCRITEVCKAVLPGTRGGEGVLVTWWQVMQWLGPHSSNTADAEWTALVITLFSMVLCMTDPSKIAHPTDSNQESPILQLSSAAVLDLLKTTQDLTDSKQKSPALQPGSAAQPNPSKTTQDPTDLKQKSPTPQPSSAGQPDPSKATQDPTGSKPNSPTLGSSSAGLSDLDCWEIMLAHETKNGNPCPPWAENPGWKWLDEEVEGQDLASEQDFEIHSSTLAPIGIDRSKFIREHVTCARQFVTAALGADFSATCLPTSGSRSLQSRRSALTDAFIALHLLREEQRLDTMSSDSFSTGVVSLTPILGQIARWLGWTTWVDIYDVEEASTLDIHYDSTSPIDTLPEPFSCPSIYEWIQDCLTSQTMFPFITLPKLVVARSGKLPLDFGEWSRLTPRTLLFSRFFSKMRDDWSSAEFVEALSAAGMNSLILETLPEAVLAPLQEAIVQCQARPPTTWNKALLAIVGREDVNMLLTPGSRPRHSLPSALLAPSHESNLDVHTICSASDDETHAFDGSAEVDRTAITRSIFKDDRRVNEAANILNTFRPTIAQVKSDEKWTESELLDKQKEHAQMLAYRTLAIPSGRGLLYFSARVPLLTQKFTIGGFNLHCVMRPDNNTIGVDKMAFTEEKVCWAFFHTGVAAGLSISRDARGIDTSWILYNKPVQDLSNRHAGFLLALGLNGHLKSVAKWVAFKYLTPKHTMTSIGLLLGLAASYIGTMDSLITRLLSVHVTRMLPPGAAELNLSPLTQTTGIMGIGLLYCNTQHRRMSEIMVSEIEHIDKETEEEPLRNEGYRLAAGFALGFINLGKGSDLKGLHDMKLTERLLVLAAATKQVDIVHVLDKATAGAVMAIALIFMKSENRILARKIDVPASLLQFDYVRPDMFLLRTLASHLIMWSQITPSFDWVKNNLPKAYRRRSRLDAVKSLTTEDLPFFDILAGLCFSIGLRFAGSGSLPARDLLIHYLDQFMRICRLDADSYDQKLTRNTVRNCQDAIALAAATVMAGTGDLSVFRRLRSLHGRDDENTPYGSHLAAHLAIGALFLGSGTFTFGTSNLAIAALLVAFYPIFPSSVQDNQSHLQAFRHFWVFAAEPRCLITRDIDTNQPVSVPIIIELRSGHQSQRHTPSLLPELDEIRSVRTDSSEYWDIVLDFENNPTHVASFTSTQTIYIRRRPAHDSTTSAFQATLQALNDVEGESSQSLEWLFELPAFATLTKAEMALVLPPDRGGASDIHASTRETVVDSRLVLEKATLESGKRDRLLGLRLLFEWAEEETSEGKDMQWIRKEVVEKLKARVWMMAKEEE